MTKPNQNYKKRPPRKSRDGATGKQLFRAGWCPNCKNRHRNCTCERVPYGYARPEDLES